MRWVAIEGYKWPYRVSDTGRIQKFYDGDWVELHPYLSGGRARAMVKMRTKDNRKIERPVVWLVADAFMGGRPPGCAIIHRNGAKLDNAVENLVITTKQGAALLSCDTRRRTVLKMAPNGEVVAIYKSVTEAAKKNFISKSSIQLRCAGKVKDPFSLDGYNYQYEDGDGRKKRRVKTCDL